MAISIDWETRIISIPKAYMTVIQSVPFEIRELDLDTFRLDLKDLEDNVEGMTFPDTHRHNTEVTLGGLTFARVIEIINGYTITFEDGNYAVNAVGANSNLADVINLNQVSLRTFNSAGLQVVIQGSGVTQQDKDDITYGVWEELKNSHITDGSLGKAISDLETLSENIDTKITDLDSDIAGVDTKITDLDSDIVAVDSKVTGIDGKVDDIIVDISALSSDTYQAKVWMFDDNNANIDRYVIVFFKNGEPLLSGITSPTIQIIKAADGTNLIPETSLIIVESNGFYRYNEISNRIVSGSAYVIKVQAIIDGSSRLWFQPIGRDS